MYEMDVNYLEEFPECCDVLRSQTNLKLLQPIQILNYLRIIQLSISDSTKEEEAETQK